MSGTDLDLELARALRDAGLRWRPASGDRFTIDRSEMLGDVFTVSEMTILAQEFDTGTILGFNGTTEWALDSVALDDALWLPREDQLRRMLGGTFRTLAADGEGYLVGAEILGESREFRGSDASSAYAGALLVLLQAAIAPVELPRVASPDASEIGTEPSDDSGEAPGPRPGFEPFS